jgi:hypothetical protein
MSWNTRISTQYIEKQPHSSNGSDTRSLGAFWFSGYPLGRGYPLFSAYLVFDSVYARNRGNKISPSRKVAIPNHLARDILIPSYPLNHSTSTKSVTDQSILF